jgi:predicted Zn finger-like uncharacterized protein
MRRQIRDHCGQEKIGAGVTMILVCSACHTRYQVDDQAVARPSGRTVRCAHCGHSWLHLAPPPAPPPIRAAEPVSEPAMAATPRPAITAPSPPRRRRSGLGWFVFLLLVAGVIAGAVIERDLVAALWPPAARLYELVHLKIEPLGAGLDIANVGSTRNADGLIVEGDITNRVAVPRDVPHLRVALRDGSQKEITFKIIPPPRERLLPGETAHFVAAFLPASDAAVGVVVTFVPG